MRNRIKERSEAGLTVIGARVKLPGEAGVEVAGLAGMDYIFIDPYHHFYNLETMEGMIRTAHSYDMSTSVRCANDPHTIMTMLDMGAHDITIPVIRTVEEAQAAVDSMYYPPRGKREAHRPLRMRSMPGGLKSSTSYEIPPIREYAPSKAKTYYDYTNTELTLTVSIEDLEGLENLDKIVRLDGVHNISTGANDLSLALGVPGDITHPKVLDAMKRVYSTALEAGKQARIPVATFSEASVERAQKWIELGVRIFSVEADYEMLIRGYAGGAARIRDLAEQIAPGSTAEIDRSKA